MTASKTGTIFNIQNFSVHDGPGIRTVIFLKGCPLRCIWCANPESQKIATEIAWQESKCIGCGQCVRSCGENAILKEDGIHINQANCVKCYRCTEACPSTALYAIGNQMEVEELLDEIEKDEVFYSNSKGGITLSGGEPLMQGEFAVELLRGAKKRHINTAVETSGYVKWEVLEAASQYLNHVLYDLKSMDDKWHRFFTGVSNALILENFKKLCENFRNLPILVRTPVIPGFNDNLEDIHQILEFIKPYPNVTYELLPYHAFGENKYKNLGRGYEMAGKKLDKKVMEELTNFVKMSGSGI